MAGIVLVLASLLFFVDFGKEVMEKELISIDNSISFFIYSLRTPILTKIMFFISYFGSEATIAIALLAVIILSLRKHKKEAFLFMFIFVSGFILNTLLKYFLKIPRPNSSPLYNIDSYSFPSAHAMNSFIFYITLSYFFYHFTKNRKLSLIIFLFSIFLIFFIGLSRIYLGVHHPSDVFAGWIAGFWWFTTVLLVEKIIIFLRLFKSESHGH